MLIEKKQKNVLINLRWNNNLISKFMEKKPPRTPEQIQERQEKRKKLREMLPIDLQLKFVQEKPEKEKWQFEGELLKRRYSKIDEDKIFYEAIKAINKKDLEKLQELRELK